MRKGPAVVVVSGLLLAALIWSYQGARGRVAAPRAEATSGQAAAPERPPVPTAPAVDLGRLNAPKPAPQETRRNPFRFEGTRPAPGKGQPSPAPSPIPGPGPGPAVMPPIQPPMPVGPPPIPLKFIGTVEAPRRGEKLAVLSDGRDVFYGKEGDVIDGRYRIVRIAVESIEMEYVDGRGRQTIRLTG